MHSPGNKAVPFLTFFLFHRLIYGKISSTPPQLIHISRPRVIWPMIILQALICGVMGYSSTKGRSLFLTITPYTLVYSMKCMTSKQAAILLAGDASIS